MKDMKLINLIIVSIKYQKFQILTATNLNMENALGVHMDSTLIKKENASKHPLLAGNSTKKNKLVNFAMMDMK